MQNNFDNNGNKKYRVTKRPGKASGAMSAVVGGIFVLIGIFVAIPTFGAFGILWTLMAAAMCELGPLTVPIGAVPISLANFVICLTAWLLGPKFGTLSVAVYLLIGLVGVPVFSGYGAGIAKLAGPTGGYLVGYLLLAFIGGLFIEKSKGQPVVSGIGLVLGDAACYVLGTAWFVFQMQCELSYALSVCVYPFIALDLAKIVVSCVVGALLRKRLEQAGVLKLQSAVSE